MFYHKSNKISLAQAMSEHFNLNLDYSNLKNEFFFLKRKSNNMKIQLNYLTISL